MVEEDFVETVKFTVYFTLVCGVMYFSFTTSRSHFVNFSYNTQQNDK